jgi:hypothetical protein
VPERAFDADDNLSDDTKRFIDWHVPAKSGRRRRRCAAASTMHCESGDERPAREAKKARRSREKNSQWRHEPRRNARTSKHAEREDRHARNNPGRRQGCKGPMRRGEVLGHGNSPKVPDPCVTPSKFRAGVPATKVLRHSGDAERRAGARRAMGRAPALRGHRLISHLVLIAIAFYVSGPQFRAWETIRTPGESLAG